MAKKTTKKKMGRPKKTFNKNQWEELDKLMQMQCTEIEICGWFELDDKTLTKLIKEKYNMSFSELFGQKRGKGKVALRRAQMQLALKGNPSMQIWLGKQYLEQKDKHESDNTININLDTNYKDKLKDMFNK